MPTVEAVAVEGTGVSETLKAIARETLLRMRERMGQASSAPPAEAQQQETEPAAPPVEEEKQDKQESVFRRAKR